MGARQVLALGSAAIGALAALNSALTAAPQPPHPPTSGRSGQFPWAEGRIHYTIDGTGPALVLVHGVGVAASSFEMRYVAEPLSRAFSVYTVDLLGFGLSDHPKLRYSADLYVRLLRDFLREVVGTGAFVVASGASGAYALVTAAAHPELVRALVISSPAPLSGRGELPVPMQRGVDALLSTPVLGQSLFHAMTARNGIRSYLRDRAYSNPDLVTESMVDAQYAMAHQPNARYAAQAYLAGRLDLDVRAPLATLRQPLLLVFGARALPPPQEAAAAYVRYNPRAQVLFLERSGSLPHEEQAERFAGAVAAWLSGVAGTPSA
jgi:pimeloyl-ACP methyl ester carboxylesterase